MKYNPTDWMRGSTPDHNNFITILLSNCYKKRCVFTQKCRCYVLSLYCNQKKEVQMSVTTHSAKGLRVGDRCASVGGTVTRITRIGNYVKIELDYQGEKRVIECSQNRKFVLFNR